MITTLDMQAMPLIRYRTGDITRILPEPCPCGGITRRLDRVRRAGSLMEELDSSLFRLEGLIDYRASVSDAVLQIDAVGDVSPNELASASGGLYGNTAVSVVAATPEFCGCYKGKRSIVTTEGIS